MLVLASVIGLALWVGPTMAEDVVGKRFGPNPLPHRDIHMCAQPQQSILNAWKCPEVTKLFVVIGVAGLAGYPTSYRVKLDDGTEGYIMGAEMDYAISEEEIEYRKKQTAECKRRGQPRIGMSASQATATCWGKPENVNRTTGASGTHDQYVYGDGRYLYFDNGILTSIQESGTLSR